MPIWLETTLYVTARLNLLLGAWVYRIHTTSFVLPTVHRAIHCPLCSPLSTMLSTAHHALQNRSRKQKILRDSFGSQRTILASSWTLGATGCKPVNCGSPVCPLGILQISASDFWKRETHSWFFLDSLWSLLPLPAPLFSLKLPGGHTFHATLLTLPASCQSSTAQCPQCPLGFDPGWDHSLSLSGASTLPVLASVVVPLLNQAGLHLLLLPMWELSPRQHFNTSFLT